MIAALPGHRELSPAETVLSLEPNPPVTIIIVNYNLSREILECLESLEQHLPSASFRVIIVDNNSTDNQLADLQYRVNCCEYADLLKMEQNIGFGSACNEAAAVANTEYLCFLNPDTTVENNFLDCLISTLRSRRATMVGPVYGATGPFEFSSGYFPNLAIEFLSIFMLGRHLEAMIMSVKRRMSDSSLDVDWILGACMLISKADFDRVNGFDTDYFLYFEEVDLCKRLRNQGGVVTLSTKCFINHTGSVSGKKDYALFTDRFYQGKLRYLTKQTSGLQRALLLRLVWLQLHSQRLLWLTMGGLHPAKSGQKLQGLAQALKFYRTLKDQ